MYEKYGIIHKDQELFDKMHDANIILWFVMITWYAKNRFFEKCPKTSMQNMDTYTRPRNCLTICMMKI